MGDAGNEGHPRRLLLRGFPASSSMYRELIEWLAGQFLRQTG
jgi:hypothetical protein